MERNDVFYLVLSLSLYLPLPPLSHTTLLISLHPYPFHFFITSSGPRELFRTHINARSAHCSKFSVRISDQHGERNRRGDWGEVVGGGTSGWKGGYIALYTGWCDHKERTDRDNVTNVRNFTVTVL